MQLVFLCEVVLCYLIKSYILAYKKQQNLEPPYHAYVFAHQTLSAPALKPVLLLIPTILSAFYLRLHISHCLCLESSLILPNEFDLAKRI